MKLSRILQEIQIRQSLGEIPEGWSDNTKSDLKIWDEDDIRIFGGRLVKSYSAPMEGWDENHTDDVKIIKVKNGYKIEVYIPFGDFAAELPIYKTLQQAFDAAVEIMEDLKEDWDDYDDEEEEINESKITLREMSEGLIKKMVALYQTQTQDSEDQIIKNIKRFDQLSASIAKKLADNNPLILNALPDELKKPNTVKDITKYTSYDVLVKVLKATDTKPMDPYKQAIDYFKKTNPYIDPRLIGTYVARFKQNVKDLETRVSEKDRDTLSMIPKDLLKKDAYKDITHWRDFSALEKLLDAIFPLINQGDGTEEANDATINADLLYNKNGIEIYVGDEEHKCVKYSKGYSWCIGAGSYQSYRYNQTDGKNRLFYFVFDRNAPKTNKWHVVVIHVNEKGLYTRTSSKNDGDEPYGGTKWEELGKYFPDKDGKILWDKIKDLGHLFKYKNPNPDELRKLGFKNKKLNLSAFSELEPEDKQAWLRVNAKDRNLVTPEIVKSLPPFGDVSKNDLINYDREFSLNELKPQAGLIKRYAEYTLAHRPDRILPAEFIPYLKPETQEKYFISNEKQFLNYDFILKYFGEEKAKEYVATQAKKSDYLPSKAYPYIPEEYKPLYDVLNKYQINWKEEVSDDEENLAAPRASVNPIRITYKQYIQIPKFERDWLTKIGENKQSKLTEDRNNILYSVPTIFADKNKYYYLLPVKVSENLYDLEGTWVIIDESDQIIKNINNINEISINNQDIFTAELVDDNLVRYHPLNKVKVSGKPLNPVQESLNMWAQYSLQRKAGIIK